ncbi:ribosome biogenesis protein Tsr1 [Schizosaccharomyces cryophilus OY26]|uniref:Ribosome biogenesis protein Tsr1 n=1 Tax=Schizosaccharomyces cryophilus (strain OY26 / ATCC MYA-4695 / CBS 11777 / NBRC 106824 / NRRL Y48691) TaxID=653667 RepID=S9X1N2_SCHCR|nr:ribosome biogenesis protein Tsr1 [Schizosaccharomyces cryophilus OY26]EPY51012.1 ribosome biogenesis protein Tsr1 [Schizosaccharomyces cryophilus OY26]
MAHHHRSNVKPKKPFKSKHASKSSLKERYSNNVEPKRTGPKSIQHTSTKADRRNTAKQIQLNKRNEAAMNNRIFGGKNGAPKVITIVPLCANVDPWSILRNLLVSVDPEADLPLFEENSYQYNTTITRFKQKLQFLMPGKNFYSLVDACKASDYVIFGLSATQEVDEFGELVVRTAQCQGISSVISVVNDMSVIDNIKIRGEVKKSLQSFMNFFFSDQDRVFASDVSQDALNVMRALCTSHPRGIFWRDSRAYLLAQSIDYKEGKLAVKGIVRGKGLDPDSLIHIQGFGDFQVNCIYDASDLKTKPSDTMEEDKNVNEAGLVELAAPTENQEQLETLAPNDVSMEMEMESEPPRGVRLDDFYYLDNEEEPIPVTKRVPKGTSSYQAVWIPGVDEEEEQYSDVEDTELLVENEGGPEEEQPASEQDESEVEDDAKSEMFVELNEDEETRQYEDYRRRMKEQQEDLEFPDELELDPKELARERLKKYRGLRSFYTSPWDAEEYDPSEPPEWRQLYKLENYRNLKNKLYKQPFIGEAKPGMSVVVELRDVPVSVYNYYSQPNNMLVLYSLMAYENRTTVSHFTVMKHSEYEDPIASKEELIMQVGPRRLYVNPLYSDAPASGAANNLQKYYKYLQAKQPALGTIIGPIVFGGLPVTLFKPMPDGSLRLAATGSFLKSDTSSVIVKRAVLTGHPFKIHKKLITVRYMFFNPEDVMWFKPIQLFTKQGRTGFIKEPLGTHGYFKATFNGKLTVQDTIAMSLYKRMYPIRSRLLTLNEDSLQ